MIIFIKNRLLVNTKVIIVPNFRLLRYLLLHTIHLHPLLCILFFANILKYCMFLTLLCFVFLKKENFAFPVMLYYKLHQCTYFVLFRNLYFPKELINNSVNFKILTILPKFAIRY